MENVSSIALTSAVIAAVISAFMQLMVFSKSKKKEVNAYRYSRLYDLIASWYKFDSNVEGDTAEQIAVNKNIVLFLDDTRRYELAKPLLDKCYILELDKKQEECDKFLNFLMEAEKYMNTDYDSYLNIRKQYFHSGGEFSDLLRLNINKQIIKLLSK